MPLPFALLLDIFKRSTFRAVKKRYILLYNVHEIAGWIIILKEEKFADSKGYSEAAIRRTDNTVAKRRKKTRQRSTKKPTET